MHWTFGPINFSDPGNQFASSSGQGTLSGSFLYDAETNIFSDIRFVGIGTRTTGSFDSSFFPRISRDDRLQAIDIESGDRTGGRAVSLSFFDPLTDAGGVVSLESVTLGICQNEFCSFVDSRNALDTQNIEGSIGPVAGFEATGTPVPLPAGLVLMLAGIAGIRLAARRR